MPQRCFQAEITNNRSNDDPLDLSKEVHTEDYFFPQCIKESFEYGVELYPKSLAIGGETLNVFLGWNVVCSRAKAKIYVIAVQRNGWNKRL